MRRRVPGDKMPAQDPRISKWQDSSCTPSPFSCENTTWFPYCGQLTVFPQHNYIYPLIWLSQPPMSKTGRYLLQLFEILSWARSLEIELWVQPLGEEDLQASTRNFWKLWTSHQPFWPEVSGISGSSQLLVASSRAKQMLPGQSLELPTLFS